MTVDDLIAGLKDPDRNLRERAAVALGELGDARAVPVLIAALKDDNFGFDGHIVRVAASTALGQIGDPRAIEILKKAGPSPLIDRALEMLGG